MNKGDDWLSKRSKIEEIVRLGLRESIIYENDKDFKNRSLDGRFKRCHVNSKLLNMSLRLKDMIESSLSNVCIVTNIEQLYKVLENAINYGKVTYTVDNKYLDVNEKELNFVNVVKKDIMVEKEGFSCLIKIDNCEISNSYMYTVYIKNVDNTVYDINDLYLRNIWYIDDLIHLINNLDKYIIYFAK